jgi:hypothetical protein
MLSSGNNPFTPPIVCTIAKIPNCNLIRDAILHSKVTYRILQAKDRHQNHLRDKADHVGLDNRAIYYH